MVEAMTMHLRKRLFPALLAAALAWSAAPAHADDTVHIGSNIHVATDATIDNAVCIFCSVRVDGKVTGDVVAIFGNVRLRGGAQHDVVSIFGSLRAEKGSSIEDNVVSVFGGVHLGDGVAVGQDLVALFGNLEMADTATVGGDRVVQPAWIALVPLLFFALLVSIVVREVRANRRRKAARRFPPVQMP